MSPQWSRWRFAGRLFCVGSILLFLTISAVGLLGPGCRERLTVPVDRNLPPQTVLTGVPGDSTTNFYRLHLYWNGYDPDGAVVGYEWAITDSLPPVTDMVYHFTTRTDSIFLFNVEENREVLGHRFYIRAVDNEGKRDPIPKWTFFTVRDNCVPTCSFIVAEALGPNGEVRPLTSTNTTAPGDTIPSGWGLHFTWTGSDCDRTISPEGRVELVGQVVGYDHKLLPTEMNWVSGGATQTTASYAASELRSDSFEMLVRARDDAGLTGSDPALRTFVWNYDPVTNFELGLVAGRADSVPVFYASTTGVTGEYLPYAEGDTLPLVQPGVTIRVKVRAVDPDPPYTIVGVQARLVKDADFWTDLGPDRVFVDGNRPNYTGDYKLMARSLDGLDRWDGTPALIHFSVNQKARYLGSWEEYTVPAVQRPVDGGEYPASGRDTMMVRFAASDPDYNPQVNDNGLEFIYRWESYPLPGGSQGSEVLFSMSWELGHYLAGTNAAFRLPDDMITAHLPNPRPSDPRPVFLPGEYILVVRAREAYNSPENADRYGYRVSEQVVHFRLR
jgi:hypothetical protein